MKKSKLILISLALIAIVAAISSFTYNSEKQDAPKITKAICVLYPTQGNTVTGIITFTQMGNSIHVIADIHGLSKGKHGFHIHEFGDCSAPDGTSTGGHFNPGKMEHGAPMSSMRHEGDMGNVDANEKGDAHLEYMDAMISFEGKNSIIGRGIIVHASEDDLKTQPTGAAGARIAYGVIGIAKGE
jgi:Cu-Zn family superoxide dismutase